MRRIRFDTRPPNLRVALSDWISGAYVGTMLSYGVIIVSWWLLRRDAHVMLPVWLNAVLCGGVGTVSGVIFATGRHRARLSFFRRVHGQCLHCGYSLRGNVSGVCPECGTAKEAP